MTNRLAARGLVLALFAANVYAQAQSSPLRVVTTALRRGTASIAYSETLVAAGGRTPYRWQISKGGVNGVALSSNGVLTVNTGLFVGQTVLTATVTDAQNNSASSAPLLLVIAPAVSIPTTSVPVAVIGEVYNAPIVVSGGVGASPAALSSGSLPDGLVLSGGVIQGIPRAEGTFTFTVEARDLNGSQVRRELTLRSIRPLSIDGPVTIDPAVVGQPLSIIFRRSGGIGPYRWSATGTFPAGVTFFTTGRIGGTPAREGTFQFRVTLTDTAPERPATFSRDYTLIVRSLLSIQTDPVLPNGRQGESYSGQLRAVGGTQPLRWSITSGTLPAGMGLNPEGRIAGIPGASGFFIFTATATDAGGFTASRSFALTIQPPAPVVTADISPDFLVVQATEAGDRVERLLRIDSTSPTAAAYQATVEFSSRTRDWLTVASPVDASAAGSGHFRLTFDPIRLTPGSYSAIVRVEGPGAANLTVPVTLLVNRGAKVIVPTPLGLTFSAIEGGPPPPSRRLSVINDGVGSLTWTATPATLSGGPNWLTVSNSQVLSEVGRPGSLRVSADSRGLPAGQYYGTVRIDSAEALNSQQSITVVLEVRPRGSAPRLDVEPAGLILSPGAQEVVITNSGDVPIEFFTGRLAGTAVPWFEASPASGTIAPGGQARLFLQVFTAGLAPNLYRGQLNIAFSNNTSQQVELVMVVPPGGFPIGLQAEPDALTPNAPSATTFSTDPPLNAVSCSPTQLVPISTLFGNGFNVPAGWPTPVEVRVVTDCGIPQTTGSVTVSFSNGDAPLTLAHVGEGRWSGTWVGRNAVTPQVTLTVRAEDLTGRLQGLYRTTGGIVSNTDPPIMSAGGVVNAASFQARAPLAPGTLISIFGSRLATTTARAESLPLASTLGVTTVTLGGRLLPLMFASDGQINAVVPYDVPLNTPQGLLVRRGTSLSVPEQVVIAGAQPGVFAGVDATAAVADASGRRIGPENPAVPGSSVSIYTTGLGPVTPDVVAGVAAPQAPLSQTRGVTSVTVNGVPVTVTYSGLTPGFTGLYQINVVLPGNLTPRSRVPLVVSVDGQPSPTVYLPVQ